MGGSTHVTSQKYDGIIVQSSLKNIPIAKGWGTAKVGCNLVDYLDFTSKKVSSGGKGGGAQPNYDYYATLVLAIALGPIAGIRTIYKDSAYFIANGGGSKQVNGTTIVYSPKTPVQAAGLSQLFLGSIWQSPWTYLTSAHPGDALGYSGIAYAAAENYNLNSAATPPNFNFEAQFNVRGTVQGATVDDANPADILDDLLPDVPRWPGASVIASLGSYQTYCYAQGLLLSPVAADGRQASDLITEILTCSNSDCFVSEGLFQVVPMGDTAISANGVTFTPNLTPIYQLTWDDILVSSEDEDPIQWDIKPAEQCNNCLTLGFEDRSQQYAEDSVPAYDAASCNAFGKNQADAVSYDSIKDAGVAATVAQLLVQRSANVRRTAQFTVSELYGLLDPMDLIEIPAPDGQPLLVRITEVAEQDDGSIDLSVEEMLVGAGHAPIYTRQDALGIPANFAIDPGDSVAPVIINPPMSLTGGEYQAWIATAGGPEWGGCNVWVSLDGTDFYQQGTITQPGRFGVTTADFPVGSDPDTSDTLSVNLSSSGGELTTATSAAADAQTTLCAVGTEVIAYSAATLTSPNQYNLGTYIRRGLEGTTIADQPSGSLFLRLDDAVCSIPYNEGQIGKTVYVKLQSFNLYGNAFEDLDLCETYTFTAEPNGTSVIDVSWGDIAGVPPLVTSYVGSGGTSQNTFNVGTQTAAQVNSALSNLNPLQDVSTPNTPPAPGVNFSTALDANGNLIVTMKGTVATATDANIAGYEFLLGLNGGAASIYPVAASQTSFTWQVPPGVSYSLQVREVKLSGVRGSYSPAATGTTTNNLAAPGAATGLSATGGYGSNFLAWTNPSNLDLDHIEVWAGTSSSIGAASQVGSVKGAAGLAASYVDGGMTTGTTKYYWVRAVNTSGNKSAFTGPASAAPVGFPSASLVGNITSGQISSVAAASITGSLTATQIASVNASTIAGILAAANIPSLSSLSGQVSASQVSAVSANVITGSITASQIGSVNASAVTGRLGASQIGAVNTSAILAGALPSGVTIPATGVSGTLTASQIAGVNASVVSGVLATTNIPGLAASQIISGQFGSAQIGAASILASKLAAGVAGNLVADPSFLDAAYWTGSPSAAVVVGYSGTDTAFTQLNVGSGILISASGSSASSQTTASGLLFPVEASKYYRVSGLLGWEAGFNGYSNVRLDFYTATGSYISSGTNYAIDFRTAPAGAIGNYQPDGLVQAPTNAALAKYTVSVIWGSSTPAGNAFLASPVANRGIDTAFIVAGSIVSAQIAAGTIVASNIASGTITGSLIAAGTITAGNILSGTITGSLIAAGTIQASNILAGTITATQIAANTITASNLAIGSFTNNLILNGNFASGASSPVSGWNDVSFGGCYIAAAAGPGGGPCVVLPRNTAGGLYSNAINITPGATYLVQASYGATAAQTNGIYFRLFWSGTKPTTSYVQTNTGYQDLISNAGVSTAFAFSTLSTVWTAPAGATWLSVILYNDNSSGTALALFAGVSIQQQLSTGNISAGAITSSLIASNTIVAGNIAAGTITAVQIAANTITGANILAGTITASLISASTITASQLAIGVSGNLIPNPNSEDTSQTGYGAAGVTAYASAYNGSYVRAAVSPGSGGTNLAITNYMPCVAGDYFYFEAQAQVSTTSVAGGLYAYFILSNGSGAGSATAPQITNPGGGYYPQSTSSTSWTKIASGFTAPTNAVSVAFGVFCYNAAGTAYFDALYATKMTSGSLIVNGSITGTQIAASTITGSLIAAGTITAGNILSGTITATQIAANTITGANIAAGTITASNIQAGTITATQISASAGITASQLSVGNLAAITANLGTVNAGYIQNSAGTTFFDLNNGRQQFTVGSYVLRMGTIGSGVLFWYGPSSVALGSETTTNGVWCFSSGGVIYQGTASLAAQQSGGANSGLTATTAPSSGFASVIGTFSTTRSGGVISVNASISTSGTSNTISIGTTASGTWTLYAVNSSGTKTSIASGTWSAAYTAGEGVLFGINGGSQNLIVSTGQFSASCPANTSTVEWDWTCTSSSGGTAQTVGAKVGVFGIYTPPG